LKPEIHQEKTIKTASDYEKHWTATKTISRIASMNIIRKDQVRTNFIGGYSRVEST